jgi:hypothetical protein
VEPDPVRQAGKAVMISQALNGSLAQLALMNILDSAIPPDNFAVLRASRSAISSEPAICSGLVAQAIFSIYWLSAEESVFPEPDGWSNVVGMQGLRPPSAIVWRWCSSLSRNIMMLRCNSRADETEAARPLRISISAAENFRGRVSRMHKVPSAWPLSLRTAAPA